MKKILIALLFANLMTVNTISSFAQETSYSEGEIPSAPSSDWSIYENDLASQRSGYTFDKLFANDTTIIVEMT